MKKPKSQLKSVDILVNAFKFFPKRDRIRLSILCLTQIILNFLDLVGVAFVGIFASIALNGIKGLPTSENLDKVFGIFKLEDITIQYKATIIAALAGVLFLFKTLMSLYLSKKIILFLSIKQAEAATKLTAKLLNQDIINFRKRTQQENLYYINAGVSAITTGMLSMVFTIIADVSSLLFMVFGLVVIQPLVAAITIILFASIGISLYAYMKKTSYYLGRVQTDFSIQINQKTLEVLNAYREAFVKNRRSFYVEEIKKLRFASAKSKSQLDFLPGLSRYIIEFTLVLSIIIVAGLLFVSRDASGAVSGLSVFAAASMRISPAALRIQQSAIAIRSTIGSSEGVIELLRELNELLPVEKTERNLETSESNLVAKIDLKDVTFKYDSDSNFELRVDMFSFGPNELVAITGSSGSGKSTFVDLILGLMKPNSGTVLIAGEEPKSALRRWPGQIAYVPQEVMISNGTIRENIALGYPNEKFSDEKIWEALTYAQLADFVKSLKNGLDEFVGDRGNKLSGGQKQRLGLARALFTKPKLIVLDEPNSSLDNETSHRFDLILQKLKKDRTIILISHRLESIKYADQTIHFENGIAKRIK